ncbi:Pentatricopeptide repeat [Parasponia andersonii]|uniref:Pentatricopeptide repeat n=1 Tax=Parasponia andersonii TaxID=3476 RepID=A0A2P5D448_PARAD|nr:Pentatricopeptide repeat [Parasponia andersonii]
MLDEMTVKSVVAWNAVISGIVDERSGYMSNSSLGLARNSLINLCGTSESRLLGKQIHGIVLRQSFDLDVLVATALIDMYSKNGSIVDAHIVFDTMAIRNVVSWTTMIVGYGQHGESKKAIELFRQMLQDMIFLQTN